MSSNRHYKDNDIHDSLDQFFDQVDDELNNEEKIIKGWQSISLLWLIERWCI